MNATGAHVLVVDDEESVRKAVEYTLGNAGYLVTIAENGLSALEVILNEETGERPVDMLFTDVHMPTLDGVELIDKLADLEISIPTIVFSGFGNKDMVLEMLRRGCVDYVDKPITPATLLSSVSVALSEIGKTRKEILDSDLESYQNAIMEVSSEIELDVDLYKGYMAVHEDECHVPMHVQHKAIDDYGGDIVDFYNTPTGCVLLFADVSGKDYRSSYLKCLIKGFFQQNCRQKESGLHFFELLAAQLRASRCNEQIVSALWVDINIEEMRIDMIAAGYPYPIRFRAAMPVPSPIIMHGKTFTRRDDAIGYACKSYPIAPGDRYYFHSDGLLNVRHFDAAANRWAVTKSDQLDDLIGTTTTVSIAESVDTIWSKIVGGDEPADHVDTEDNLMLVGIEIPETLVQNDKLN